VGGISATRLVYFMSLVGYWLKYVPRHEQLTIVCVFHFSTVQSVLVISKMLYDQTPTLLTNRASATSDVLPINLLTNACQFLMPASWHFAM
jgi:hypothetical protein